jgi:hypothetical protein
LVRIFIARKNFGSAREVVSNIEDEEKRIVWLQSIQKKEDAINPVPTETNIEKTNDLSAEMSGATVDKLDSVEPVATPEPDVVTESEHKLVDLAPETVEKAKTDLDLARENYARAKIEFNKKNSKYNKIKGSLEGLLSGGILSGRSKEKSPTEIDLEEAQNNLDEALAAYISQKKIKKDEIIDVFETQAIEKEQGGTPLTPEEEAEMLGQIKIKLLEQAEQEWNLLQEQIDSLSSGDNEKIQKVKELAAKGLKVWSKVPAPLRMAVAPILIGTGVGLTAGLGAGALYAGTRLGRGIGGAFGSRVAGNIYGKRTDKINTEAKEKSISDYTDESSGKTFEQRETGYMQAREEELKRKNNQRIKKAMVMVGAGAGAGILTGLAESALSSGVGIGGSNTESIPNKPKITQTKVSAPFDGVIKPKTMQAGSLETALPNKEAVANTIDTAKPSAVFEKSSIKVELSSKGFLQDIHNLKANIIKQYGDNIPPEIKKNIIDRPTVEIAKDYGLYKPGEVNDSAVGFVGEKLSMNDNGQLIIEHVDGTKETLSHIGRDTLKQAPQEAVVPTQDTTLIAEKLADVPVDVDHPAVIEAKVPEWDSRMAPVEQATIPEEPKIIPTVDTSGPTNVVYQIPHNDSVVEVLAEGESKIVKFGDQTIAHEQTFGNGKLLVLDDKFQDGAKYKDLRSAFAKAFEKSARVDQIGSSPTAVEFEGGKIYIVQGLKDDPMGMKVLLNGKEIASGSMEVKGSVLSPKLKFDSGLKGGWFLDDNAYERAFKNVKKFLQIK